jgi:hypothetical protein
LELAERRRESNDWDLEDTDDIGLRANALFKYLVSIDNLQELTPENKSEIARIENEITRLQAEYDNDEEVRGDLLDEISELEDKLGELDELTDVYTLLPAQYGHNGLTQFENIVDGTEWAVGDESEMEQASRESVESLIDDIGIEGFNRSFIENHIDEDGVEAYIRDFFNHDVYDSPESYLDNDDKEISSSQKQEIVELRQEEIELDTERNELNSDDFEEDYIEQRTSEIETRLLEIQDEIEEINNNPDGDYDEDAIERVIDDRVSNYTRDIESFVSEFMGTDYFQWILDHDFVDKDAFIESVVDSDGYGVSLNSYDGDVNEEVIDGRTYYIIRVS